MSTRRSARLRSKGRRPIWINLDESFDDDQASSGEDGSYTRPPKKRSRISGEEETEQNDEDYLGSDDNDVGSDHEARSKSRRSRSTNKSFRETKDWDRIYDEDDEFHEAETVQEDFPLAVDEYAGGTKLLIDGYVYRKLPTERTRGLGGIYLRCYQDEALNCDVRAIAVKTNDGQYVAKLSTTANQHNHERPTEGSFTVPVPPSVSSSKKQGTSRTKDGTIRPRGRPPKVPYDLGDDVETEPEEADTPARYKIPIEVFGMQKYFIMDGYVYRRHKDRRFGLRGLYLRCYQDRELNCKARAVGVWFRKRTAEGEERGERLLIGRLSTTYNEHNHPKPQKGRFWVKPKQRVAFLPPTLGAPSSATQQPSDFADFLEPANVENLDDSNQADTAIPETVSEQAMPRHRPTVAKSTTSTQVVQKRRGRPRKSANAEWSAESRRDGPNETEETVCMDANSSVRPKVVRPNQRGQDVLTPKAASTPISSKFASSSMKGAPASSSLFVFTRTPFVRPLVVKSQTGDEGQKIGTAGTQRVNLKFIMNCYRYCLDSLIRLQDGYYVSRFPQLRELLGAKGSDLTDYVIQMDNRLPLIANDERTRFFLNHEMKQFRAICDFMLIAPNECERLMDSYRRWLTPSRTRAWWNTGDILELACRILLRKDEYMETYESALMLSQQSTRLRFLFRPLLPLPIPKFLHCEKESSRRWEMRQSLESLNARISSERLREKDPDATLNRLLDEFDSVVRSFMRFFKASEVSDESDEDKDKDEQM